MEHGHDIVNALKSASIEIYDHVKSGEGLKLLKSANASGDDQIGLDMFADGAFRERLSEVSSVSRVVSEEGDEMTKLRDAPYSVALDPIDGSKAALVGIPCGAIFAIFEGVDVVARPGADIRQIVCVCLHLCSVRLSDILLCRHLNSCQLANYLA